MEWGLVHDKTSPIKSGEKLELEERSFMPSSFLGEPCRACSLEEAVKLEKA